MPGYQQQNRSTLPFGEEKLFGFRPTTLDTKEDNLGMSDNAGIQDLLASKPGSKPARTYTALVMFNEPEKRASGRTATATHIQVIGDSVSLRETVIDIPKTATVLLPFSVQAQSSVPDISLTTGLFSQNYSVNQPFGKPAGLFSSGNTGSLFGNTGGLFGNPGGLFRNYNAGFVNSPVNVSTDTNGATANGNGNYSVDAETDLNLNTGTYSQYAINNGKPLFGVAATSNLSYNQQAFADSSSAGLDVLANAAQLHSTTLEGQEGNAANFGGIANQSFMGPATVPVDMQATTGPSTGFVTGPAASYAVVADTAVTDPAMADPVVVDPAVTNAEVNGPAPNDKEIRYPAFGFQTASEHAAAYKVVADRHVALTSVFQSATDATLKDLKQRVFDDLKSKGVKPYKTVSFNIHVVCGIASGSSYAGVTKEEYTITDPAPEDDAITDDFNASDSVASDAVDTDDTDSTYPPSVMGDDKGDIYDTPCTMALRTETPGPDKTPRAQSLGVQTPLFTAPTPYADNTPTASQFGGGDEREDFNDIDGSTSSGKCDENDNDNDDDNDEKSTCSRTTSCETDICTSDDDDEDDDSDSSEDTDME